MDSLVCLAPPCLDGAFTGMDLMRVLVSAFHAILFLQSGIDKIVDRKGNMAWLTGHFAKSPLASLVSPMVTVITLVEVAAGALSGVGVFTLLFTGSRFCAALGALLAALGLLMLFFGQRMAKDYAGAAGLVPYFIVAVLSLGLMSLP
ncbi:MAG TPA: hypothetical protein VFN67_10085 [Polyangiales bacterium]|nr:hypothetical protein [Polyangiales bacterium]